MVSLLIGRGCIIGCGRISRIDWCICVYKRYIAYFYFAELFFILCYITYRKILF